MAKDITQLDDYTKLKKLASALWQQNNSYHGAAIMIGAGFSRKSQFQLLLKLFVYLNF